MADEDGDESGATVKLSADTAPFQAALDEAAKIAGGWADKVNAALTKAMDKTASYVQAWSGRVSSALEKAGQLAGKAGNLSAKLDSATLGFSSDELGEAAGTGIGAAIGAYLGPVGVKLGAELGGRIGKEVGKAIDLNEAVGEAIKLLDVFKPVTDEISGAFDHIKGDAEGSFADVRKTVAGLKLGELFTGDFNAAWARIGGELEGLADRLGHFFDRVLYRVVATIDGVWGKIKEPIASAVDFVQKLLVKFGLVDASTQKWGDSLRAVEGVGRKVAEAIATALGAVEGAMKQVGGAILVLVVIPIMEQLPKVFGFVAEMLQGIAQISKESLGGFMAAEFDKASAAVTRMNDRLKAAIPDARRLATELNSTRIQDTINNRVGQLNAAMNRGGIESLIQDFMRDAQKRVTNNAQAVWNVLKLFAKDGPAGGGGGLLADAGQRASAMIQGSREAVDTVQRADNTAGQRAADRVAMAAEDGLRKQDMVINRLDRLIERTADVQKELQKTQVIRAV